MRDVRSVQLLDAEASRFYRRAASRFLGCEGAPIAQFYRAIGDERQRNPLEAPA